MLINVRGKNSRGGRVQHFAAECVKELNQNLMILFLLLFQQMVTTI